MKKIMAILMGTLMMFSMYITASASEVTAVEPKDKVCAQLLAANQHYKINVKTGDVSNANHGNDGGETTASSKAANNYTYFNAMKANEPTYMVIKYDNLPDKHWVNDETGFCQINLVGKNLDNMLLDFEVSFEDNSEESFSEVYFGLSTFTTGWGGAHQLCVIDLKKYIEETNPPKDAKNYYHISMPFSYLRDNGTVINAGADNMVDASCNDEFRWDYKVGGIAVGAKTNKDTTDTFSYVLHYTEPKIMETLQMPQIKSAIFNGTETKIEWNAVSGAAKYKVECGGVWNESSSTSITLPASEEMKYSIYAVNEDESIVSKAAEIVAKAGDAHMLLGGFGDSNCVKLTWGAPVQKNIAKYGIFRNDEKIADVTETSYVDYQADTSNDYVVKAFDAAENIVSTSDTVVLGKTSSGEIKGNEITAVYYSEGLADGVKNPGNGWMYRPYHNIDGYAGCVYEGSPAEGWFIVKKTSGGNANGYVGLFSRAVLELNDYGNGITYSDALNFSVNANIQKSNEAQRVKLGVLMSKSNGNTYILETEITNECVAGTFVNVSKSLGELLNLGNRAVYEHFENGVLSNSTNVTEADLQESKVVGIVIATDVPEEGSNNIEYKYLGISGGITKIDASSIKTCKSANGTAAVWNSVENAAGYYITNAAGANFVSSTPTYFGTDNERIIITPYFKNGKIGGAQAVNLTASAENNVIVTDSSISDLADGNISANVRLNAINGAKIVLAVYKNNKLVDLNVQNAEASQESTVVSLTIDNLSDTGYTVKTMAFENANTLMPSFSVR